MSVHAQILEKIEAAQSEGNTKLIAIDGRGGSGKSTFAARLIELNPGLELLELDSFPCSAEEYPFHQTGTQTRVSTSPRYTSPLVIRYPGNQVPPSFLEVSYLSSPTTL